MPAACSANRTSIGLNGIISARGDLGGYWSRRIDQTHRLVYTVDKDGHLVVIQARHHY